MSPLLPQFAIRAALPGRCLIDIELCRSGLFIATRFQTYWRLSLGTQNRRQRQSIESAYTYTSSISRNITINHEAKFTCICHHPSSRDRNNLFIRNVEYCRNKNTLVVPASAALATSCVKHKYASYLPSRGRASSYAPQKAGIDLELCGEDEEGPSDYS
jgi:hypothetical protein